MSGWGRIWLSLAASVFVLAATFSGLDRYTEHDVGALRLVPAFARADGWRVGARQALAKGDMQLALTQAQEAVRADPMDSRGLGLLGMVQLAADKPEVAASAFAAADRLGLRTAIVQAYFFDQALAAGDAGEAATRLDTLLITTPRLEQQGYFFAALEASEAGRRELASRILAEPRWSAAYLTAFGEDDTVLRARATFIARHPKELPLGCARIEPMLRELARRSFRSDAARLAASQCPARAISEALADPGFDALARKDAFGWRRHASGDVRISAVGKADPMVEIANRSATTRLVLSQPVVLAPGEYRVFAIVVEGSRDAALASLDCGTAQRPSGRGGALGRGQLLRAPACDDLVLGIWVKPGEGTVRLDNLRLEPVGTLAR